MAQIKAGFTAASDLLAGTSVYRFVSPKSLIDACAWYGLTDASTIAINQNNGYNFTVAVGASGRTIANMSNAKIGTGGFIEVVNTAGGSKTLNWGTDYELPTGVGNPTTLSTGTGAVDLFSYVVRASGRIFVTGAKNFA